MLLPTQTLQTKRRHTLHRLHGGIPIESESSRVKVRKIIFKMKLSPGAIALVAFSIGANAFISSPSRSVYCRHAVRPAAIGRRLQSGLILQSTVEEEEDVAATAAAASEDGPIVLPAESADAAQSPLEGGDDAKAEVESEKPEKPGMAENSKFQCEESVEMWQELQRDGFWSAQENLRELGNVGTRFAQMGPEALSHWLVSCLFSTYLCLVVYLLLHGVLIAWLLRTLVLISFVHSYM